MAGRPTADGGGYPRHGRGCHHGSDVSSWERGPELHQTRRPTDRPGWFHRPHLPPMPLSEALILTALSLSLSLSLSLCAVVLSCTHAPTHRIHIRTAREREQRANRKSHAHSTHKCILHEAQPEAITALKISKATTVVASQVTKRPPPAFSRSPGP